MQPLERLRRRASTSAPAARLNADDRSGAAALGDLEIDAAERGPRAIAFGRQLHAAALPLAPLPPKRPRPLSCSPIRGKHVRARRRAADITSAAAIAAIALAIIAR